MDRSGSRPTYRYLASERGSESATAPRRRVGAQRPEATGGPPEQGAGKVSVCSDLIHLRQIFFGVRKMARSFRPEFEPPSLNLKLPPRSEPFLRRQKPLQCGRARPDVLQYFVTSHFLGREPHFVFFSSCNCSRVDRFRSKSLFRSFRSNY